jgi:hypothetical protein
MKTSKITVPFRGLRPVFLILLLALPLFGAMPAFESNLGIPVGQQFVLGGYQKGKVNVKLNNTGVSAVELRVRDQEGNYTGTDTLRPGQEKSLQFPPQTAAVLRNLGKFRAEVHVKGGSSANLGMGYEDF